MASSKLTLTADSGGTAAIQPAAALSTAINLTLPTLGGNLIAANSAIGTSGQVITTDGANIYWAAGGGGGSITINNDTTTATAEYPLFSSTNSGSLSTAYTSSGNLTFKPSNGLLTAVNMAASQGILYTANTISTTVTLPTGYNGVSAGAVSVTGSVSVPAGSTWVVDSGAGSGLTASNNTWTGTNAFNNGVSLANIVSAAVSGTITVPAGTASGQPVNLGQFTGTNQSLSGSGYQKLPGGLIIQWLGTGGLTTNQVVTLSFPIAYPNNLLSIAIGGATMNGSYTPGISWSASNSSSITVGRDGVGGGQGSAVITVIGY